MRRALASGLIALAGSAGCAASPAEGPARPERPASDEAPATMPFRAEAAPDERAGGEPPGMQGEMPGERAPRPRPGVRTGNAWADCYRRFQPSDDPASDLARLGGLCGEPAAFEPVTSIHVGSQGDRDPTDRLIFRARKGRCYRVFAVGAPAIADLDVAIFNPAHDLVAADLSTDRWSVVPPRGPLCVPRSGAYTVEIAVAAGRGDYLLQVWGNKDEPPDDGPGEPPGDTP
ncbi:MAG: hypothetical protein U0359_26340 [Byssovorax sp.]